MPRIRFINAVGTTMYNARMQRVIDRYKSPSSVVDVRSLSLAPELMGPMVPEDPFYHNEILRAVKDAEGDGYTAVIIGCAIDPALGEAQRWSRIPVVAPLQAAAAIAASRGKRLAVLYPDEHAWKHTLSWARYNLRAYGLEQAVACIRFVDMHIPGEEAILGNPGITAEDVFARFHRVLHGPGVDLARRVLVEDAAEMVFFGCTLWAGMLDEIAGQVEAPLIDPVVASVRVAEMQSLRLA